MNFAKIGALPNWINLFSASWLALLYRLLSLTFCGAGTSTPPLLSDILQEK